MSCLEQVELDLLVLRSYKKVYCCILQMCKRILQFKNRSESTERFRLTQVRMKLHARADARCDRVLEHSAVKSKVRLQQLGNRVANSYQSHPDMSPSSTGPAFMSKLSFFFDTFY